jgi:uncharacterized protein YaaN involved in tellurite resistance
MPDNMDYAPTLTFGDKAQAAAMETDEALQAERDAVAVKLDISQLSEADQKTVREFARQIDITDTNAVLTYGAPARRRSPIFSGGGGAL